MPSWQDRAPNWSVYKSSRSISQSTIHQAKEYFNQCYKRPMFLKDPSFRDWANVKWTDIHHRVNLPKQPHPSNSRGPASSTVVPTEYSCMNQLANFFRISSIHFLYVLQQSHYVCLFEPRYSLESMHSHHSRNSGSEVGYTLPQQVFLVLDPRTGVATPIGIPNREFTIPRPDTRNNCANCVPYSHLR